MTLVSFFSLVACQKEGDGKILFTATIETPSTQSKTSITNTGVMTWLNGDQIAVFDNGGSGVVSHLTATPTGNHKTADFMATTKQPTSLLYQVMKSLAMVLTTPFILPVLPLPITPSPCLLNTPTTTVGSMLPCMPILPTINWCLRTSVA